MPTFRPEVRGIKAYEPGRPIEDVALEMGLDPNDVIKLASNESPLPPIPAVQAAIAGMIGSVHRYPDDQGRLLRSCLAERLGVSYDEVMIGAGSSEILRVAATAVGGPGTSSVYAWPSFVVYRLGTILALARPIEVPLDSGHRHDLGAMLGAIDDETTAVYLCNPNNPTGTVLGTTQITEFVDAIPERVLVVVDEAYHDFVTDRQSRSALPLAVERPNVLVAKTFSKIHGLAALRVGYGISRAENITELRKAQAPFSVTSLGQAAALESMRHPDELARRVIDNAAGRELIEGTLARLGVEFVPSQSNFVYLRLPVDTKTSTAAFLRLGIILRPFSEGWLRVSVGTEFENQRFLAVFDKHTELLG